MPELLKNKYYNYASLHRLALSLQDVYPPFQVEAFVEDSMDKEWETAELKARMRKITLSLGKHLPREYPQALAVLDQMVVAFPPDFNDNALIYLPDFVEVYGQEERHWDLSMAALERYTKSSTAEFAVRPFIINHEERMMAQMAIWARHENEHVRRLASEGCRPALPWGQALVRFKKDPLPVLAILEQLKDDPSLYVRKSVANNLNDISKTHPDLVCKIAREWYGKSTHTDWIVKHGCRTLLKQGNRDVLAMLGFVTADCVKIKNLILHTKVISIGEALTFSFGVVGREAAKVRLEYGIDYVKSSGKRSRKIFQISQISLQEKQEKNYTKTHAFANLSGRIHYPGMHSITLIVNGTAQGTLDFQVLETEMQGCAVSDKV